MNAVRVKYFLKGNARHEDFVVVDGNLLQAFEHASDYAALLKDQPGVAGVELLWRP